jgi:hypothetical protein
MLCVLDPSLHYIVVRWYPECLAERACKMMNRQLRNFGEHFQSDIFLQMRVYIFAYTIAVVSELEHPWENTSHSSYKPVE